jgi:hypothetical protein
VSETRHVYNFIAFLLHREGELSSYNRMCGRCRRGLDRAGVSQQRAASGIACILQRFWELVANAPSLYRKRAIFLILWKRECGWGTVWMFEPRGDFDRYPLGLRFVRGYAGLTTLAPGERGCFARRRAGPGALPKWSLSSRVQRRGNPSFY